MALTAVKTWGDEYLTFADLNAEFLNIYNNALTLISPLTGNLDANGNALILDADADTWIVSNTDDSIDFTVGGSTVMNCAATALTLAALEVVMDTDGDSSLTVDTDDVLHMKLQGFDAFIFDGDVASPVNGITFTSSATGNPASIAPQGEAGAALTIDMNGGQFVLDVDGDSSLTADTDDQLDIRLQAFDAFIFDGTTATIVNGLTFTASDTGNDVTIGAHGEANTSIDVIPAGTGVVKVNGGVFTDIIYNGSVSWDAGSIDDGNGAVKDITGITGAAVGDYVMVSTDDASYDNAVVHLTGRVAAADEVQIVVTNHTGISFAPGTATYYVKVYSRT